MFDNKLQYSQYLYTIITPRHRSRSNTSVYHKNVCTGWSAIPFTPRDQSCERDNNNHNNQFKKRHCYIQYCYLLPKHFRIRDNSPCTLHGKAQRLDPTVLLNFIVLSGLLIPVKATLILATLISRHSLAVHFGKVALMSFDGKTRRLVCLSECPSRRQ